jgi:hypothetical protein
MPADVTGVRSMALLRRGAVVRDMKLICDVLADAASFTEPEVVHFPGMGNVVRFRLLPILYGVVMPYEQTWYLKYVQIDPRTGEPTGVQPNHSPEPMGMPGMPARQVGMNLIYEALERWGRFSQNADLSARDRKFAEEALSLVDARISSGPPHA